MKRLTRRQLMKLVAGSAGVLGLESLLRARAGADIPPKLAKRLIVFYFPDGVPGVSSNGEASLWHATGGAGSFSLPDALSPLIPYKNDCVFFNGLSMGGTDAGSHPGGAKKLLTAVDGGNGESIDRYLARTVGAGASTQHLYLGAMANQNNASGDKHISYISPGLTTPPEDNPLAAFQRVFTGPTSTGGMAPPSPMMDDPDLSILDAVTADIEDLQARLGATEKVKLSLHLDALRELEKKLTGVGTTMSSTASCTQPAAPAMGQDPSKLYEPSLFPDVLRAQTDLMVQAMACGLTQVGVIQSSVHTSELIMSRFPGTQMYDPGFDMRSHQASHYGAGHDFSKREFAAFVQQTKWFVSQFAYLVDELKKRPDGAGTMLDTTMVLLCTEICDGNTHLHDNMPFVLAGGGGTAISSGQLIDVGYRRHADLYIALAQAMGANLTAFGDNSSGALPGLLKP